MHKLEESAQLAEELAFTLRELSQLIKDDSREQLNCGLHLLGVYERLMVAVESEMHPDYRKNLEEFRNKNLR